jgi:hypothetical protein
VCSIDLFLGRVDVVTAPTGGLIETVQELEAQRNIILEQMFSIRSMRQGTSRMWEKGKKR